MIQRCLRYIRGYLHIRFSTEEEERFLNICSSNGIVLWNLNDAARSRQCCIGILDFKKLPPIARKTKTSIKIIKKQGLPFFLQKSRKRKAFFLGVLCFGMILYLLSLRVWNIHVAGNQTYSTHTILKYLQEEEITHGIAIKDVDCSAVAAMLRRHFSRLSWVSAHIEGTRLFLEMKEQETVEEHGGQEEIQGDLVAETDGIVKSIVTRLGVPLVREGDRFRKGDILVSGLIELQNDNQETVGYREVRADATIQAWTTHAYYDEFSMTYKERVYTGEEHTAWFVTAFDHRLEIGRRAEGIKQYDQITDTVPVYLTENFLLPVTYGTIRTRFYRIQEKQYTQSEAIRRAQERLYCFLQNLTQKGVEIYRKDVKIYTSESTCVTKGSISTIESAGVWQALQKPQKTPERTAET